MYKQSKLKIRGTKVKMVWNGMRQKSGGKLQNR